MIYVLKQYNEHCHPPGRQWLDDLSFERSSDTSILDPP
ncbi:Protein of unknown function [Pyronema omphalodes CBS 100304]|uniref:Uncharacterized protein n=1 Tax=Pyronema omphalodes (strain CBS 100304) TaxID=1076935 RepID=U4L813_PYROM|nr:Protein of unknown function [Pyronema omphalodes CBS 100304]